MSQKTFHRHFPTPGASFYWILFIYLVLAWFYPVVGLVAIICMVGPVVTALRRGRYWCGHICPRGNMYDRLLSRYSPHRPIPRFVRSKGFRIFMVVFIFSMFGLQLSQARWSEGGLAMWGDIGRVFWTIILVTTVVGVVMGSSPPQALPEAFHLRACRQCLRHEVQDVRQSLSHAAHALRCARQCRGLSAPRLSEVRQVCQGLPHQCRGHFSE